MIKEIGFVCVGQAGGNIGLLLEKGGHDVFYINTSREDLDSLEGGLHKYHIKGGEGCNKDRDKAKEILAENIDELVGEITSKIQQKIIFVIFAAGGGTGSGTSPYLMNILQQETDRRVGAIAVLPAPEDSFQAHYNAYEAVAELADIPMNPNMASTLFIDNKNISDKIRINQCFYEIFQQVLAIPDRYKSMKGNIDRAELKKLLTTPGVTVLTKAYPNKTDATARLIGSFRKNIFAPMETDRVIKYIGVTVKENIDLQAVEKETGTFLDSFIAYGSDSLLCILSGLSFPFTRMEEIKRKIMGNRERIAKSLQANPAGRFSMDLGLFQEPGSDKKAIGKSNPRELLKKYVNHEKQY